MGAAYKIEDIIITVHTSLLSMYSAMCLCSCYRNNVAVSTEINKNIEGISINDLVIPPEIQRFALQNASLERFVISSSLRGVFSAMYEGLKYNAIFKVQIESVLKVNYSNFFSLINLLRNFYSHELTWCNAGQIIIKSNDFMGFVAFRNKQELSELIPIDIKYKDILPPEAPAPVPDNYGIIFVLDTKKLKEGMKLEDVFPIEIQFKLAELCHNLCNMLNI